MMPLQNPQPTVLIVADTLFSPPRRNGFSVRYYPLIRELTNRGYLIDIMVINKYKERYTQEDIYKQRSICNRVDVIPIPATPLKSPRLLARKISNIYHRLIPVGIPYHLIDNNRDYMRDSIKSLLIQRDKYDYGIGVGVGGNNANMLLSLTHDIRPRKIICDFVDSAFLLRKRSQYGSSSPLSPITHLVNEGTRRWEKSICDKCTCVYISDEDARTVGMTNAHIIPNCVVEDDFETSISIDMKTPNIAFLGNMSYPPNIEACTYLILELLPAIMKRIPGLQLYIIGRQPSKEILQHGTMSNIHITGEVNNVWDYIRSANAFVFPMQTGAGLQNKVLEAMYAGKPVITTQIGNEGIGAKHGSDIYIAETIDEYAKFIEEAIYHSDRISNNARVFVQTHYSIHNIAGSFEKLLC